MDNSFFEEDRLEEHAESEGSGTSSGRTKADKRCDRLAVYALILGILSIFCIFFTNGYLISMLGLLIDAHALNQGTRRRNIATAAAICCAFAVLLYIVCVAAKPLLCDMQWYMIMMEKVNGIFGN